MLNCDAFLSLKVFFIFENNAHTNAVAFHLCLRCLPSYLFAHYSQNEKG